MAEDNKTNTPLENEPEVVFNSQSDRRFFSVKSEDGNETMMEISGYDLDVRFNRNVIKTVQDVESLLDGIKDLFRKIIMEDLIGDDNSNHQ
ncbi:hypothetical protein [Segatella copri]|jgi:hypothetical protein|uniref:Uncharacterized protein n=1 Tax=Segatella copri TaxID=165179 RepID=A0AAW5I8E5_9BACT|nr:hypothetical protein [Segatella copri]UWI12526.1 MAG: hypothetical protein [Bacteriophage sp.]MCP9547562.1 hypothetical protein [Segatella copri]MCP9549473.1 hypothetical protein [Segatella copri]MCP9554824.1 hypothetical protein [Segatella copri]MCP9569854.1 hypothetical protein [Segatella copri]